MCAVAINQLYILELFYSVDYHFSLNLGQINALCLLLFTAFRFTSVFPPEPHYLANENVESLRLSKTIPSCIQPLEVMIQVWLYAKVLFYEHVFYGQFMRTTIFSYSWKVLGTGLWMRLQ